MQAFSLWIEAKRLRPALAAGVGAISADGVTAAGAEGAGELNAGEGLGPHVETRPRTATQARLARSPRMYLKNVLGDDVFHEPALAGRRRVEDRSDVEGPRANETPSPAPPRNREGELKARVKSRRQGVRL
jgi:hypothetical protein